MCGSAVPFWEKRCGCYETMPGYLGCCISGVPAIDSAAGRFVGAKLEVHLFCQHKTWEPLKPQWFQGFPPFSPAGFPLSAGNALDELLHPLCAVAFHLVRHMAVDIQGKGGRGVSQIPLYGLDIIPALNRGHGVAMPLWHNKDKSENLCVARS